jgi:hypothetical protein
LLHYETTEVRIPFRCSLIYFSFHLHNPQFSKEPLIPIGCLTTAYFLGSGIRSFYNRDSIRSQKMMRLRVGAQLGTLLIFIGYAGINSFNLEIAPGYHAKKSQEEQNN